MDNPTNHEISDGQREDQVVLGPGAQITFHQHRSDHESG